MPSCKTDCKKSDCRCCRTCSTVLPGCAVEYHQRVVMSGCGWPPGSCCFDGTLTCGSADPSVMPSFDCALTPKDITVPDTDLCQPVAANGTYPFENLPFLYENFVDTCAMLFYTLIRNPTCPSVPLGYYIVGGGDAESLTRLLQGTHGQTVRANAAGVIEGQSFVFLEVPPSPAVMAALRPSGGGETLTPDIVMAGARFGFQVYIRDKRNNRYFRDSYNSHCTEPLFPCSPCNLDCFVQYLQVDNLSETQVAIPWQFSADTCHWYLADMCEGVLAEVLPDLTVDCELACCWNNCGKRIGKNLDCKRPDLQKHCVECPKKKCGCGKSTCDCCSKSSNSSCSSCGSK